MNFIARNPRDAYDGPPGVPVADFKGRERSASGFGIRIAEAEPLATFPSALKVPPPSRAKERGDRFPPSRDICRR